MNFKSCKRIHETFSLDAKFEPFLTITADAKTRAIITNPLEKGYIYASLFFYDEVIREMQKLDKMIRKIMDEIRMEIHYEDPSKILMELSARVRRAIGDDSLDAFIKEILAEESRAISLLPTDSEVTKFLTVKEAIYTELFDAFVNMTFRNASDQGEFKSFKFTDEYIGNLTDRQKKLISPALRMAGFISQIRLDEFVVTPDWTVRYKPVSLREKFDAKEEEIKSSLKKLMEQHYNDA
ncbi:MAG: hypothetical protein FWE45_00460 [Firmicutes bacterium]|nr:hypothetical protein [Bacillota bacterium]